MSTNTSKPSSQCRHLLDSLSEYVDGTLQDSLCLEIERHLAECDNCRVVVDTLRRTVYLVQTLEQARPNTLPSDVRVRLFHKLHLDEFLEGDTVENQDAETAER